MFSCFMFIFLDFKVSSVRFFIGEFTFKVYVNYFFIVSFTYNKKEYIIKLQIGTDLPICQGSLDKTSK